MRNETKSDLVRKIAAEFGCSHSTSYFVKKCRSFGVEITHQQAHSCLGPFRYRGHQDSKNVTEAAKGLLKACDGDLTMAVRCLKINGGKQ